MVEATLVAKKQARNKVPVSSIMGSKPATPRHRQPAFLLSQRRKMPLFSPPPAVTAAATIFLSSLATCPVSTAIPSAQLANEHGLTIADFDGMIASELPVTYSHQHGADDADTANHQGGTNESIDKYSVAIDAKSEELFNIATARKWDFNEQVDASTSGIASPTHLYPYVMCSSDPNLSGYKRIQAMDQLLAKASTPPLGSGGFYFIGSTIINERSKRTCIIVSSHSDPYEAIVENLLAEADYVEYQPLMFAMKMAAGTTDELLRRIDNPNPSRDVLSIVVSTCPVYSNHVKLGLATRAEMRQDIMDFLTGAGSIDTAQSLYNSSFYVEAGQDVSINSTRRMNWWASVINSVTDATDPTTGSNTCFDGIISQRLQMEARYKNTHRVFVENGIVADGLEMSQEEFKDCLMYVVAGLALHPYVCQLEPEFYPVPFPDTPTASPAPTVSVLADTNTEDPNLLNESSGAIMHLVSDFIGLLIGLLVMAYSS